MANRHKEEQHTVTAKGTIRFRYMDSERACDFSVENVASESLTEGLRVYSQRTRGTESRREPNTRSAEKYRQAYPHR